MWGAVLWGGVAASSLLLGAGLGMLRRWPDRLVGLVLAFGAGALIAAVSFELALKGLQLSGTGPVAIGLAVGALAYYLADRAVERPTARRTAAGRRDPAGTGTAGRAELGRALALGSVLDGVPEQLVLGIGLAIGPGISLSLLVAVTVSNLPEAIGAAAVMRAAGHTAWRVAGLWLLVTLTCAAATPLGYALAEVTTPGGNGAVNGFAGGAVLVMLIDSMIPAAAGKAGATAGLATVLGFAIAAGLSALTL